MKRFETQATIRGDDAWFTGTVFADAIAVPPAPSALRVHDVTFTPGARTRWHDHPAGQVLVGVAGRGVVCSAGRGTVRITPGVAVWIEPDERHWHGATDDRLFTHLAIQEADPDGLEARWYEPVSESEYLAALEAATGAAT